jgi:hypothetical protein
MIIPELQEIINRKDNKRYIAVKYPEFYKYLSNRYNIDNFSEMLYLYYHNLYTQPKCICGNDLKFQSLKKGYSKFCSTKCANNSDDHHIKTKQTCQERYGGIGNASNELLCKSKQTRLERYGDENYVNIESRIKTNMEKYGTKHYMSTVEFSDKSKQTKKERYGNENYTNQEKANATKIKRYGSIWQEGFKKTNLERLGVEYPFQSKEIQDKIKKGLKEKYGVKYALQHKDLLQKSLNSKIQNFLQNNPDIISIDDFGDEYIYTCKCPHPDCTMCDEKQFKISSQKYHGRKYRNDELCTILSPGSHNKNTFIENFVKDILNKYNVEYVTNTKDVIPPKELDIYIPSKKIAIECNGVFWHSDKWKDENYHYNKYIECQKQGVQLISIWEDQVYKKPEIIESIILSKLNIYKKIIDSNYFIGLPDSKEYLEFMFINNINGVYACGIKIGLYYNGELMSVMCFSKINKDSYILQGYHQKLFTNIVNGHIVLFDYFTQKYNPKVITGYSSNDLYDNLFKNLAFEEDESKSNVSYIDNKYNRMNLVLRNTSVMYKIHDSGQTKWIFSRKN